jgi:yecA family protein
MECAFRPVKPVCIVIRRGVLTCAPMSSIKFTDAAQALQGARSTVAAAEAHGCLCGALCAVADYPPARWFDELFDETTTQVSDAEFAPAKELLQSLHQQTSQAMRSDQMAFSLLLPDDDEPLARRADALAQWCQGFLYGFGSASGGQPRVLSDDVQEVLRDLAQIARASAGDEEPTEEDEEDYAEIVEYIRAGVQLVHDELRPTLQ